MFFVDKNICCFSDGDLRHLGENLRDGLSISYLMGLIGWNE